MTTNNKLPKMYDTDLLIQAGIDPTTGLPIKATGNNQGLVDSPFKSSVKKQLRIKDEQQAVNRFTWYGLPPGLNSRLMERILYYKGQGMFFKIQDKFFFLPFALDGEIDVYGRFRTVTPLPFNGTTKTDGKETPWITGLRRDCIYEAQLPEDFISEDGEILVDKILDIQDNACVLIKDYTEQISQTNISRQILNDGIIDVMSDLMPFMRTALLNGTGVDAMRVVSQDEQSQVEAASRSVNRAAIEGKKWIPVIGNVDFQALTSGQIAKAEEYLLAMQSLDNYRLSLYGLDSSGMFEKKSHMLQDEIGLNQVNNKLVFEDSLRYRQDACVIINSIWGLSMWCMPSESVMMMDMDGDGVLGSNTYGNENSTNYKDDSNEEESDEYST